MTGADLPTITKRISRLTVVVTFSPQLKDLAMLITKDFQREIYSLKALMSSDIPKHCVRILAPLLDLLAVVPIFASDAKSFLEKNDLEATGIGALRDHFRALSDRKRSQFLLPVCAQLELEVTKILSTLQADPKTAQFGDLF